MPKGESPYLPLARECVARSRSRGVFLLILDGAYGDGWCAYAPPEVAARLPEMLTDAADEIASEATRDADAGISLPRPLAIGDGYQDLCREMMHRARAALAFLHVVEGHRGSGFSLAAIPRYRPLGIAELIRGFAKDLGREEMQLRAEAGLATH